jgi:hypothetical protein
MRIRKLLGQVSVVALCAVSLSACADKMYYGSELGQGAGGTDQQGTNGTNGANGSNGAGGTGTAGPAGPQGPAGATGATGATGAAGATGATGATGPAGSLLGTNGTLSGGLGLTGSNGALSNVAGSDPLGGLVDGLLGTDNGVSQISGTPSGSTTPGLVPTLANDIQNGTDTSLLGGGGLGITGAGGLVDDLIDPPDPATQAIGTEGTVPATLAGGQDGLLGNIIGGPDSKPLLPGVGQTLAKLPLISPSSSIQQLGVTGEGGVSQNLFSHDLLGNVLGTQGTVNGVLAGGSGGALGGTVPSGNPALGTVVDDTLGPLAGTAPSPIGGVLNGTGTGGVPVVGAIIDNVTGALGNGGAGNLPGVGSVVNGVTGVLNGGGTGGAGNVISTVTGAVNNLPVVGSVVVGTLTGGGANGNPVGGLLNGLTGH